MIAVPALIVALVVTNTRNAWIGTFLAVCLLLAIRNWKLVLVAPAIAIVALVLAPGQVQDRARTMLNPTDPASRDRIVMWKIGRDMIRDHPVFGVGPEQIQVDYERYRQSYPEAVNKTNPHLHNVPIQIAAERGVPALVLWLWFFIVAGRDLWRQLRAKIAPDVAGAGLAALVAMFVAGLFEYNFGDSEFLMLLLGTDHFAVRGHAAGVGPHGGERAEMTNATFASRFAGRRIMVVGDVMLDHFVVGQVERISPEAPVPVVRFARDEFRLGGAANVAHNVAALGGRVRLIGLTGADPSAEQLRAELTAAGLDAGGLVIDESRTTTRKVRVVTTRNQQVARVDYETESPASNSVLDRLLNEINDSSRAERCDRPVRLQKRRDLTAGDRNRGGSGQAAGIPLLVDPKVPQAERYRGVTLLTPNHHEAELMTQTSIRTADDVVRAARTLHDRTGASVIITWGEHGMFVFDRAQPLSSDSSLPAAAREVADVTGAGDTVIAVLALGLASGATLLDAARLANVAAGLVVGRFGPAAVTAAELAQAAEHLAD